MTTIYATLGVQPDATLDDIKRAYRRAAMKWHPDRNPGREAEAYAAFQEIREAKALAYSAWSSFTTPRRKKDSHYVRAYVGTQSDKMQDAVDAMMELMNNMPEAETQFEDAKLASLKKIETSRITKSRSEEHTSELQSH